MPEGIPKQFSSPDEELRYLRAKVAERERELLGRSSEADRADTETIVRQELQEYVSFTPKMVLDGTHALQAPELAAAIEQAAISHDPASDILELAQEKGIRNALSVLETVTNAYVIDEVHRKLVELIRSGATIQDLKEGTAAWHHLHMTLYEITLPEIKGEQDREYPLTELVGMMEQLMAGLRTIGSKKQYNHFAIEIAVAEGSDDIVFYAAVPNEFTNLFEKQTLSLFPHAELSIRAHDYNVYVDGGETLVAEIHLAKHPIYPLRTPEAFSSDPLAVILNAFSKIEREGGGAAIQFVMRHPQKDYRGQYEGVIKSMRKGMKVKDAIARSTLGGEILGGIGDMLMQKKKDDTKVPEIDTEKIEIFTRKLKTDIIEANIRLVVSAANPARAKQILTELESTLNQFSLAEGNSFSVKHLTGKALSAGQRAFSFRDFIQNASLPLNVTELSTLIHFPANGIISSPQFKQTQSSTAAAPTDMPASGTYLGKNKHRNTERDIFMTELDRMRHLYLIGQTGTGKSTFLTNLIIQDIHAGHGVCMIDPHGTDIKEVLGAIPPERYDDVIYFDPSNLDYAMGLNMLEYDVTKPEQKTFVVNELLSIFQKLYGANPESMGPMFEQYFRNATMLVMEDPDSGNTLMDISRVMADASFRRMKLERAKNPVVVQFWKEIAGKAGGEASLENIVPYIVSKTDPLTSNDYLRPIIGQQQSAFNFRQIMDERKILLVNLSKGRLGEINANLIGMIFVGKILMAALSRVDDPTRSFPPFFLHIDEFQNVSTPAISSILSEARKYKLSLTVAHQFIAQLDQGIKDAVFGNIGSMVVHRVGSEDAQFLEQQFSPIFAAKDLMNIPNYNSLLRVLANGTPTKPFSLVNATPIASDHSRIEPLIDYSIRRYGRPRAEVDAEIAARYVKKPLVPPPLGGMM